MERIIENRQKARKYLRQTALDGRRYQKPKPHNGKNPDDRKDDRRLPAAISIHGRIPFLPL